MRDNRMTWRKRVTQWLRGDDRRDFKVYGGKVGMRFIHRVDGYRKAGPPRRSLGGIWYFFPSGVRIFAETLSQSNL